MGENYSFFGHSMGGLLAYLLTIRLRREGLPLPSCLFVSGRAGPSVPIEDAGRSSLETEDFLDLLNGMGGKNLEAFSNKEFIDYFLPVVRADFHAVDSYEHKEEEVLSVPIVVMLGSEDTVSVEDASCWQEVSSDPIRFLRFEGNHFFIEKHWPLIGNVISESLSSLSRDG